MEKVIIVLNAYQRPGAQMEKANRLKDELEKLGAEAEIVRNFRLADVVNGTTFSKYRCKCVFLDKDKSAAYLLEKAGCRLFNSARAMELCDDKMLTHAALCGAGINMPKTIYAPLCYYPDAPVPEEFLKGVGESLGYPLVAPSTDTALAYMVSIISSLHTRYPTRRPLSPIPLEKENTVTVLWNISGRAAGVIISFS